MDRQIKLTRHDEEKFVSETVFVSGHAFFNCSFERCTLVVTNTPVVFENNKFDTCNWRVEWDLLWGDPGSRVGLRTLLDAIDGAGDAQA